MKIIDGFIFYNELELLKVRLEELYDTVDYFILVEGTLTFTGLAKPLFYNDNKHLYEKYNDKIIHIIVNDFPETNDPWIREHFQRNCIDRGIKQLNLNDNDVIMITDSDEIPNSKITHDIRNGILNIDKDSVYILQMCLYYYTLEWTVNRKWNHCKLLSFEKYKTINIPEKIRHFGDCKLIPDAGWHITYYGDFSFIHNKLQSFSEQQDNNDVNKNPEFINSCIKNGTLHFNNEKLVYIDKTTNKNLPYYFLKK